MYVFIQSPFNIAVPTLTVMPSVAYKCPRLLRQSNIVLSVLGGFRIPWTTRDPPFTSLSHSCPCCPARGSLGGSWDVQGIFQTVWDTYITLKNLHNIIYIITLFKINYNQVLKVHLVKPTFPELWTLQSSGQLCMALSIKLTCTNHPLICEHLFLKSRLLLCHTSYLNCTKYCRHSSSAFISMSATTRLCTIITLLL